VKIFHTVENYIATTLLVLMALVVIAGAIELAYELFMSLIEPPGLLIGVSELLDIFGLFLMVLIGLELMTSIKMYLRDHTIHAEMMFLVALTAVTRKIVVFDATKSEPLVIFGIGFLIISLSAGYFLLKFRQKNAASN
jgi:uncharacterized membrane protein (DUF373 family)